MQTCTLFVSYISWLTRELEKTDPDLAAPERPPNMSANQWQRFQEQRKPQRHGESTNSTADHSNENGTSKLEQVSKDLARYEHNFSRHLQILLDALNHYAATETVVLRKSIIPYLSTSADHVQLVYVLVYRHAIKVLSLVDSEMKKMVVPAVYRMQPPGMNNDLGTAMISTKRFKPGVEVTGVGRLAKASIV